MSLRLCVFSSTPDINNYNFVVKTLTGEPEEIMQLAVDWGYDGIEFLPDPYNVPDPKRIAKALRDTGATLPVLNTGRMAAQGITLLHEDKTIRIKALEAFKSIIDLAGHIDAKVGLGISRGNPTNIIPTRVEQLAEEVFSELATYAEKAGTLIMLEPADPGATNFVTTVQEAVAWVKRINSPNFTLMLDTYQLVEVEESLEQGIEDAEGRANHIHLYDPCRWPPGVRLDNERLDWKHIAQVLKEKKFDGTGSIVIAPEGDPATTAKKAVSFLRKLFL